MEIEKKEIVEGDDSKIRREIHTFAIRAGHFTKKRRSTLKKSSGTRILS